MLEKKFLNTPIAVFSFRIIISFSVIILFPSQNYYLIDNSIEKSISIVKFFRGGYSKNTKIKINPKAY